MVFYSRYYFQQAAQRQQAEELLAEVQLAYDQVEASTIRTERQRVARELHDTLTQGLAGTVMQLEAAESCKMAKLTVGRKWYMTPLILPATPYVKVG